MNILFFILKTKLLKNGEAPILMRITIDGHYEEIRIQRSVPPKLWDSSKECSRGKDRTAKELNTYIAELSALALQKHKELKFELALITPRLLLKRVFGKDTEMRTLLGTMGESAIKITRSEISLANAISWVTITIVICRSASDLITFKTSPVNSGSSADVGSSKNRIFGFRASALAIATRWHCPPESWQG